MIAGAVDRTEEERPRPGRTALANGGTMYYVDRYCADGTHEFWTVNGWSECNGDQVFFLSFVEAQSVANRVGGVVAMA